MYSMILFITGAELEHDIRLRRQSGSGGTSILTVEWEGIHSKVSDDRTIGGFRVEYRPETDLNWIEHDGIIPYQGPNMQYRVRIRDLPSGIVYYVRIKVLGRNNEVLVETPEIKAQTELVKIVCSPGMIFVFVIKFRFVIRFLQVKRPSLEMYELWPVTCIL